MKKQLGYLVLTYLRLFAKLQLLKNKKAVIIGITGNAGKTSTRKAIALICRTKGIVKESIKANSESGIILNILGITMSGYSLTDWLKVIVLAPFKLLTNWEHFDYYVVELGIDSPDSPKNMSYLLSIIRPDVGVVLNTGMAHGTYFDHLVVDKDPVRRVEKIKLEIAREKMKLVQGIKPTGIAVVNIDQKELLQFTKGLKARLLTVGSTRDSRLRIKKHSVGKFGFKLGLTYQNQDYELSLPDYYEDGYVYTFAMSIATCAGLGIPVETSVKVLSKYQAPAGRLRKFKGINDLTIIDSTYNSSPITVKNSLILLEKVSGKTHKIAIIGDMRELGKQSKTSHKVLADWLMKYTDEVLLFGEETGEYTFPVLQSAKFPARHFTKIGDLDQAALNMRSNSTVLIKGSQNNILLERVVEKLLLDKKDVVNLCRRGEYWDRVRAKTP